MPLDAQGKQNVNMWIERQTSADFMNKVLNDPIVRPDIADAAEGVIDITPQVANRDNVLLCGDYGGFMYFKLLPGVYEVHSAVVPMGRGRWALKAARASLAMMFTHTDAAEILTRIPGGHLAAQGLATKCGFRHQFVADEPGCLWRGNRVPAEIWSLTIQSWGERFDWFAGLGEWFHAELTRQAARRGIIEPPHAPDQVHNHYVGIALSMLVSGQPRKAVFWYNRWALAARHKPVILVCDDPIEIAMDIGVLRFDGESFELVRLAL